MWLELRRGNYGLFRWFLQQTAIRSIVGRDSNATYTILLFLAHLRRNEIRAFWERLVLARDQSREGNNGLVGSLRCDDKYVIFFVASQSNKALKMDYLLQQARKKCDPHRMMQVYVWWEDDVNYRIDYLFWDRTTSLQ